MKWVEFVKSYCNRHGISYKEALKNAECKEQYHAQKGEQKAVEKGNKHFKESKDLLVVGTPSISIPDKMLLIKQNGDEAIINPLTKSGSLAKKDKQNILKIEQNHQNYVSVKTMGTSRRNKERVIRPGIKNKHAEKLYYINESTKYKHLLDLKNEEIKALEEKPKKTKRDLTKLTKLKDESDYLKRQYDERDNAGLNY